mmetsp:Transcript_21093/g.37764  ORF Transcript_21093/g.37764 Transcript_21093/m.37764 type:complete len:1723 (-) Transcript_21093:846-6014(-)
MSLKVLCLLALFLLNCVEGGTGAGAHGQNLLCNPSGEDEQPCWKTVLPDQNLFFAGSEYPQRAVHGKNIITTGGGKEIHQNVSVELYQPGQVFLFTGYMSAVQGNDRQEKGRIQFEWFDKLDNLLSSSASSIYPLGYPVANVERWFYWTDRLIKPPGAIICKVTLMELDSAGKPGMFWDALSLAANLLQNPSGEYLAPVNPANDGRGMDDHPFEDTKIASWTPLPPLDGSTATWTQVPKLYEYSKTFYPKNGAVWLAPPSNCEEAYLYQDVDVANYPVGTVFLFEAYQASEVYEGLSDRTTVRIEWRKANGQQLSVETKPWETFNAVTWEAKSHITTKPAEGDVVRLTLISQRYKFWHGGYGNRGMFDSMYFGPADHRPLFSTVDLRLGDVGVTDPEAGRRAITIYNTGLFTSLVISDVDLHQELDRPEYQNFSIIGNFNEVAPKTTVTFYLTIPVAYSYQTSNSPFTLADLKKYEANLTFTLVDPLFPSVRIPVQCTVVSRIAQLDLYRYDFGAKYFTRGQAEAPVKITSAGLQPVRLYGVTTNFAGSGFEMTSTTNPQTLQPGQEQWIWFRFDPRRVIGPNTGSFTILTDDVTQGQKGNITIALSGISENYKASMSAQQVDFGFPHVQTGPKWMPLNMTNTGQSGNLQISSVIFQSNSPACAQFSIPTNTSMTWVEPGETMHWVIIFNPTTVGTSNTAFGNAFCNLQISTNDENQQQFFVQLSGVGADQRIGASTASMYLGSQHVLWNDMSGFFQSYNLYITNSGREGYLTLKSIEVLGYNNSNSSFMIMSGGKPPNPMSQGSQHQIQLVFMPMLDGTGGTGMRNGTLVVRSDDPATPELVIQLSGTAIDPTISFNPPSHNFGDGHISTGPGYPEVIAVCNTGQLGSLELRSSQFTGADMNSWFVSTGQPANTQVQPGECHNLTIQFSPSNIGSKTATLVIQNTDPANPTAIINPFIVSGRGINPRLQLQTSQNLIFDSGVQSRVASGAYDTSAPPSAPLTFTVKNTGQLGDSVIRTMKLTGSFANQFKILPVPPMADPLPPNDERTYSVVFAPNQTGFMVANLEIDAADGNGFIILSLQARAVHPVVQLSTTTINFGMWDVAAGKRDFGQGNQWYTLQIRNNGSTALEMTKGYELVVNPGGAFSLQNDGVGMTVNAGQSMDVFVAWDPNSPVGRQDGVLSIFTNDYMRPVVNVTLRGQAIQELGAGRPAAGNVTFRPPMAGRPSSLLFHIFTSSTGLPADGQLIVDFPKGFDATDATATLQGVKFGRDRVKVAGLELVTIEMSGSGVPSVENGAYMVLEIHNVILPSYTACKADYKGWRWNITTFDANKGMLEFAFEANLPGETCVPAKYYEMSTTPSLPSPPIGLQAGYFIRFKILVDDPALFVQNGWPLINTARGGDVVKTIAARKDGYPQYCSDEAEPEGGGNVYTDDLGNLDEMGLDNANFSTTFHPGQWRLCYRQKGGIFGWEQVGEPFIVGEKLFPNGSSVDKSYTVAHAIPFPEGMQTEWWSGFSNVANIINGKVEYGELLEIFGSAPATYGELLPVRSIVNEKVDYLFTGAVFKSGRQIYAKIAFESHDCGGHAPGTPPNGALVVGGKAAFAITEPSLYKVCLREAQYGDYWLPFATLWVRTVIDANLPTVSPNAFSGFHTCAGYTAHFTDRCGCFYGSGSPSTRNVAMSVDVDYLLTSVKSNETVNQGCCSASSTRMTIKAQAPQWGYCQ